VAGLKPAATYQRRYVVEAPAHIGGSVQFSVLLVRMPGNKSRLGGLGGSAQIHRQTLGHLAAHASVWRHDWRFAYFEFGSIPRSLNVNRDCVGIP
jgi:hypothetical protein